jgi:hypothetical protein
MTISPLALQAAAAVAGTDRAAAVQTVKSADTGAAAAASLGVEKIEKVAEGEPLGDRGADGRQLLDTFERRHGQHSPAAEEEATLQHAEASQPIDEQVGLPRSDAPLPHFDMQG